MGARQTGVVVVGLLVAGCPAPAVDVETAGSSTTTAATAASTSGAGPTGSVSSGGASETEPADASDATGVANTGSSSTGDACVDVEPAPNPKEYNCALMDQDCPDCHKCTHAWDGGNDVFPVSAGKVCVPVHPEPVALYEPCSYGDGLGVDNCGADAFCWSPDDTTTDGYCIAFCDADYECAEGATCVGGGDGQLGCVPTCDPFAPDCPDATEGCLYFQGETQCFANVDEYPATPGAECFGACSEGLACVSAEAYGPDCAFDGCCTELCSAEQACSDPAQTCFGECGEPPADISVCTSPAPPNPEQCPPPDAEPNYPWCSVAAGECEAFAGGNDCVDLCFCDVPCEVPADCPVPETGNPTIECSGDFTQGDGCLLSCANGETCPSGMYCADELYPGYCMWFVELEPDCTQG